MQAAPSGAVLRFRVSVSRPRGKGTHTRPIPRVPRACPIIAISSTRQAGTLVWRHGIRLDDMAGGTVFLGIRTIQERSRRDGAALYCAGGGLGAGGCRRVQMWVLPHFRCRWGVIGGCPGSRTVITRREERGCEEGRIWRGRTLAALAVSA